MWRHGWPGTWKVEGKGLSGTGIRVKGGKTGHSCRPSVGSLTNAPGVESCRPWRDFPCFDRTDTSAAPKLLYCATFFFIFHTSAYTQKQAGLSAEANKLVIGPFFFLLFLSRIVHVEPEVLSLGDGANRTCQGLGVLSEGVQSMEIRNERAQILLAVHKLSIYSRRLLFGKNILDTQTRLFREFDLARGSGRHSIWGTR